MGLFSSKPELTKNNIENNKQLDILANSNINIYKIMDKKKSNMTKIDQKIITESIQTERTNLKEKLLNTRKIELQNDTNSDGSKLTEDKINEKLGAYEKLLEISPAGISTKFLDYLNEDKNKNKRIIISGEIHKQMIDLYKKLEELEPTTIPNIVTKYKEKIGNYRTERINRGVSGFTKNDLITLNNIVKEMNEDVLIEQLAVKVAQNSPNLPSTSTGTVQSEAKGKTVKAGCILIGMFISASIISVIIVELSKTSVPGSPSGTTPTITGTTPTITGTTPTTTVTTTTIKPVPSPSPDPISSVSVDTIIAISVLLANKISGCYLITNDGNSILSVKLEGCSEWYSDLDNQMFCSCPSNETTTTLTKPDCTNSDLSNYPFCINSQNQCEVKDPTLKDKTLYKCNGTSIDQDGFVFYRYQYYPPTSVINTINNITQQLGNEDGKKKGIVIIILIVLIIIAIISIVFYIINKKVKNKRSSRSNR